MSVGRAVSRKRSSIISGEVGWNAENIMSKNKDIERPGSRYAIKKKV